MHLDWYLHRIGLCKPSRSLCEIPTPTMPSAWTQPKAAPPLGIPRSKSTVTVRVIDRYNLDKTTSYFMAEKLRKLFQYDEAWDQPRNILAPEDPRLKAHSSPYLLLPHFEWRSARPLRSGCSPGLGELRSKYRPAHQSNHHRADREEHFRDPWFWHLRSGDKERRYFCRDLVPLSLRPCWWPIHLSQIHHTCCRVRFQGSLPGCLSFQSVFGYSGFRYSRSSSPWTRFPERQCRTFRRPFPRHRLLRWRVLLPSGRAWPRRWPYLWSCTRDFLAELLHLHGCWCMPPRRPAETEWVHAITTKHPAASTSSANSHGLLHRHTRRTAT